MTDLLSRPGEPRFEQLALDITAHRPEDSAAEALSPPDATEAIEESAAYRELRDLRDETYGRRRSGARAIARGALMALQAGEMTHAEHALLFSERPSFPTETPFDELPTEPPARELDWMERAAGEAVVRPGDDE